jgi:hypothetical protein
MRLSQRIIPSAIWTGQILDPSSVIEYLNDLEIFP